MGKHAYLIICHNNFEILKRLIELLDHPRNDIYLHVDRKTKNGDKWKAELCTKYADLVFTKRINVAWGGFSQIKAELILLQEATKKPHDYYHLISGVDLPLKSQSDIHRFFDLNQGKEYIGFDLQPIDRKNLSARIQYYRFFQDIIGRNTGLLYGILERIENVSLLFQRFLKIDRIQGLRQTIYKGPQWFSITHQMAMYILSKQAFIRRHFNFCLGVDELFLQTLAMDSPYAGNIVNDSLRYIDWNRGRPYTFRSSDYDDLMASEKLFARKFDAAVDFEIVERIYSNMKRESDDNP